MNVRERSASIGEKLAQSQMAIAWPGATGEDMEYVVSDAIANLLLYAEQERFGSSDTLIRRAEMHFRAEMGEEGEEDV